MNQALRERIERARSALKSDPHGRVAGELRPPLSDLIDAPESWTPYVAFLEVSNGATCGVIDFWSWDEIPSKQFVVSEFSGGAKQWLVIGQFDYEPLGMSLTTSEVRLFPSGGKRKGQPIKRLDAFLEDLFGSGYAEHVPDAEDDEWWDVLRRAGLR